MPPPDPQTPPPLALPLPPGNTPAQRPARPGRVARAARPTAAVGCAAAIVYVAVTWGLPGRKSTDVLTATAARGELVITVTDRGELESSKAVEVLCEVEGGGKLATIVPEGTRVKKGDEVARFDTDTLQKGIGEQEVKWEQAAGKLKAAENDLEVQRNKAEGEIDKAALALTLAKIDFDSYEEGEYLVELDKRKGAAEKGKKELKEAEDNLDFTRNMVKKGFAQMEQIRVMELNFENKRYEVRQQEADLKVLEKFTKVRKVTELEAKAKDAKRELDRTKKTQAAATEKAENEMKAARKTADLEKKQLERLKLQLNNCVVKAPAEGILIYYNRRFWDDSAKIRPGATLFFQQPIFTLPDLDDMQVKLKVHESVVKKVQKGQSATLQVDALPNQVLHGRVILVATMASNDGFGRGGVKEYQTDVTIDDLPKGAGLRPGMTADVKILIKTIKDALTVPVQAVTESGGKNICYVMTGGGIERRVVKVGDGNDQLVQILDGLAEGDKVTLDARIRAAAELKTRDEKDPAKASEPPPAAEPPSSASEPAPAKN
ncbi:efflux RND transporter periplasmic adaptor subunit [Fimbriiglobus ruber]|uniref:efflux RND transporter periplasmic adaptor subunit n=1 Tax=Fimbriiglobus ruber TaxID=1908690 RepID=UPI000B4A6612|nr:efflux RND transporter periplasmic adaptor subunit [Fimbriiglobus ruber]